MVRTASFAIVMASLLSGCTAEPKIQQVGYFKLAANDRIFTARMDASAGIANAREFAESKPYTQGQMTAVYLYDHGAIIPADGVTQASDVFQANEVLALPDLSAWRFAFMRYRDGQSAFVDCSQEKHELCRQ